MKRTIKIFGVTVITDEVEHDESDLEFIRNNGGRFELADAECEDFDDDDDCPPEEYCGFGFQA